jgi:RHS repeat-associated protein
MISSVITYQYQPISFEGGQRREGLEPIQSNSNGTVNTVYWILDQLSHHYEEINTEVDWVSFFAPVRLEHQFPLDFYFDGLEDCEEDPQCLCERQQYHAFTQLEINCRQMDISYWYHPDYLGSVEWVTKTDGSPHEFFWRDPWGHTLQYDNTSPQSSFRSMFGFTGHIEDGETGLIYAGARYYEPRVSVWLSVDRLAHKSLNLTPYRYCFNNPVSFIDPDGRKEYENADAYYKENPNGNLDGNDGHWLKQHRLDNTGSWLCANEYNIRREDGYSEYNTIQERADFYAWFQYQEDMRGGETEWAAAAYIVAKQIGTMETNLKGLIPALLIGPNNASDLISFANEGNKTIFNDVWGRLRENYLGSPMKGSSAQLWDNETLRREQFDIVQPIYQKWSRINPNLPNLLEKASGIPFPMSFKGSIMNPNDRYNHGISLSKYSRKFRTHLSK